MHPVQTAARSHPQVGFPILGQTENGRIGNIDPDDRIAVAAKQAGGNGAHPHRPLTVFEQHRRL